MTIVRPVCARLAPPQKPVFHGSCANRSAAQSDHSMASRQQRLGAHSIFVLHNAAYRPNPNPRTGIPSHSHLRGMALAQHNIDYRTFPHSVVRAGFQAVFAGGTQRPGPHEAFHRCPRTRFTSRQTGVAKSRRRLGVAWLRRACHFFVRSFSDSPFALRILGVRPCRARGSEEKTLANGGRSGYYVRVNLDTGGEEV